MDLDNYFVVEFIKRGRVGIRSIDIVPSKWLLFDRKENKMKCFFLGPPYEEENLRMLQQFVEMRADAPASWSKYNIKIVARASKFFFYILIKSKMMFISFSETYSEALTKLKVVECNKYAFTSNSEIEPEQQSHLLENEVRKKMLQKSLSSIKTRVAQETQISAAESSNAKTKSKIFS